MFLFWRKLFQPVSIKNKVYWLFTVSGWKWTVFSRIFSLPFAFQKLKQSNKMIWCDWFSRSKVKTNGELVKRNLLVQWDCLFTCNSNYKPEKQLIERDHFEKYKMCFKKLFVPLIHWFAQKGLFFIPTIITLFNMSKIQCSYL